jgi:hypothetical protein
MKRSRTRISSAVKSAHIIGHRRWFLGASTEWPGVFPTEDVEFGNIEQLAAKYPDVAAYIAPFLFLSPTKTERLVLGSKKETAAALQNIRH